MFFIVRNWFYRESVKLNEVEQELLQRFENDEDAWITRDTLRPFSGRLLYIVFTICCVCTHMSSKQLWRLWSRTFCCVLKNSVVPLSRDLCVWVFCFLDNNSSQSAAKSFQEFSWAYPSLIVWDNTLSVKHCGWSIVFHVPIQEYWIWFMGKINSHFCYIQLYCNIEANELQKENWGRKIKK